MTPYLQVPGRSSTLDYWRTILDGNCLLSLAAFAYITDSGVAQLKTFLPEHLWATRQCKWLFGIDYGRSQPTAIRKIAQLGLEGEVRIYDGIKVVSAKGFTPRKSFHLKTAFTVDPDGHPCKQIVGSGNLSASGLSMGIEAGCLVDYRSSPDLLPSVTFNTLSAMWEDAVDYREIIDEYEELHSQTWPTGEAAGDDPSPGKYDLFWIDVGYVTKNRGLEKPGNQFDMPKGSHAFLGLQGNDDAKANSVLGRLVFITPLGNKVERPLRLGANGMEKITLPLPEQYGYGSYDGKIITFEPCQEGIILNALEYDDFVRAFGRSTIQSNEMNGGRRYGTVVI